MDENVSFSDGVETCGEDLSITKNGIELKFGNDVILPLTEDNKVFIAYSHNGRNGEWNVPDAELVNAEVYEITADGNKFCFETKITDKKITLDVKPCQALAIKLK